MLIIPRILAELASQVSEDLSQPLGLVYARRAVQSYKHPSEQAVLLEMLDRADLLLGDDADGAAIVELQHDFLVGFHTETEHGSHVKQAMHVALRHCFQRRIEIHDPKRHRVKFVPSLLGIAKAAQRAVTCQARDQAEWESIRWEEARWQLVELIGMIEQPVGQVQDQ